MKKHWFKKCNLSRTESSAETTAEDEKDNNGDKKKLNGWKCMPYIIGNETFERVASLGLTANFTIYLVNHFHMEQVVAAQVSNVFSATTNFAPLLGAFISDAYWGRFRTLAYASVASFLGMIVLTLTACIPVLRPATCAPALQAAGKCPSATKSQMGVLILSLVLLTIGAGGVRPCSLPFGVDQFDKTTEKGRRELTRFFNWYYATSTLGAVVALTFIIYLQEKVSWSLGFGIPTLLMLIALVFFFSGTRLYDFVPPEGSVFSGIIQVFVAAYRKRKLMLPAEDDAIEQESLLFNPVIRNERIMKLPLTLQFRCLNKAAIKREGELKEDGTIAKPWTLCTVQQIEEVKCLLRIVPIWASGIVGFVALSQQFTFAVLQGLMMDRHMGPHFEIPPATLGTLSLIALTLFIPIYDLVLVPIARRFTKLEGGITLLQRQGVGLVILALSMIVAGVVEEKRRTSALAHGGISPLSAFWLSPQLIILGIGEAFNAVGQIEFYNRQFPEHMQTLAGSLFYCTLAGAGYVSALLISVVQNNTNWLANNNINAGKLDYFYYIIAGLAAVNFIYFLICAHFYRYKGVPEVKYSSLQEVRSDP